MLKSFVHPCIFMCMTQIMCFRHVDQQTGFWLSFKIYLAIESPNSLMVWGLNWILIYDIVAPRNSLAQVFTSLLRNRISYYSAYVVSYFLQTNYLWIFGLSMNQLQSEIQTCHKSLTSSWLFVWIKYLFICLIISSCWTTRYHLCRRLKRWIT